MQSIIGFCLFVGIGSTIVLDLWVTLIQKLLGIPPTNWGMVGRWLLGLPKGKLVLDTSNNAEPTLGEKTIGWLFHYLIGFAYAAIILILWGTQYIVAPTLLPAIIVGLVLSTIAGLAILLPAMGGGFFGRKLPNPFITLIYLVVAHAFFTAGQYIFAIVYSRL